MVNTQSYHILKTEFDAKGVTLVAVSKMKPASDILELYNAGQRDFGENYVQELVDKQAELPADIRWHFIGHLQGNKVKQIAPFVHLIHAVDSYKLLEEINKQGLKSNRVIDVLLQLHIADEETKFGLDEAEIMDLLGKLEQESAEMQHVRICGLMGMATNTDDTAKVKREFHWLHSVFQDVKNTFFKEQDSFATCSIGMSADYAVAIEEGSTMVRIGSLLFGAR